MRAVAAGYPRPCRASQPKREVMRVLVDAWLAWSMVALVAVAAFGVLGAAVVRLFSRRAQARALEREATAFESALVGAEAVPGARAFDAWSYRVGARFAGRVRIVLDADRVVVAGPRVPRGIYRAWIAAQAALLALVPPLVLAAVLALDPRIALLALLAFIVSWGVSMLGAGLWPGLGELPSVDTGHHRAVSFEGGEVVEIDAGAGWEKGGLGIVLLPYVRAITAFARQRPVSFFAPDEDGLEIRFALHMTSDGAAAELAPLLRRGVATRPAARSSRSV
jgi:hypothetical protein